VAELDAEEAAEYLEAIGLSEPGLNTLIRHQVDLSEARNLIIVSVTLVFGIGGMVIGNSDFALSGISLCAICALVLNLVLPGGHGWRDKTVLEEPDL
jgi:uracil permease